MPPLRSRYQMVEQDAGRKLMAVKLPTKAARDQYIASLKAPPSVLPSREGTMNTRQYEVFFTLTRSGPIKIRCKLCKTELKIDGGGNTLSDLTRTASLHDHAKHTNVF